MKIKIGEMQIQNIDYRKLKPLQGNLKDLSKTNYSKLKKSFTEKGLFVPMFVWQEEDVFWLLDGHGRERLFSKEKAVFVDSKGNETFEIPALIIQAKDLKDAEEKILLISSQFQRITQEGFDEFTFDLDASWLEDSINFDAFPYLEKKLEAAAGGGKRVRMKFLKFLLIQRLSREIFITLVTIACFAVTQLIRITLDIFLRMLFRILW